MDYFTGKALEYDIVDDDEDFDDDDDDEDDDQDGSSGSGSQDSESDDYPARGPRGLSKGRRLAGAGANSNPDECKQQWEPER